MDVHQITTTCVPFARSWSALCHSFHSGWQVCWQAAMHWQVQLTYNRLYLPGTASSQIGADQYVHLLWELLFAAVIVLVLSVSTAILLTVAAKMPETGCQQTGIRLPAICCIRQELLVAGSRLHFTIALVWRGLGSSRSINPCFYMGWPVQRFPHHLEGLHHIHILRVCWRSYWAFRVMLPLRPVLLGRRFWFCCISCMDFSCTVNMNGEISLDQYDKAFEMKLRLQIMSILMVHQQFDFNAFKELLDVTDGNLPRI